MTFHLETEITIHASADKIWQIFSDFDNYPNWNPLIRSIQGPVGMGKTIKVSFKDMNFKSKILAYEEKKELRWIGHLIIPGIFDGEHYFTLKDLNNGSVEFIQGEHFSGILIPIFKKQLDTKIRSGFVAMNQKLKELSEATFEQ